MNILRQFSCPIEPISHGAKGFHMDRDSHANHKFPGRNGSPVYEAQDRMHPDNTVRFTGGNVPPHLKRHPQVHTATFRPILRCINHPGQHTAGDCNLIPTPLFAANHRLPPGTQNSTRIGHPITQPKLLGQFRLFRLPDNGPQATGFPFLKLQFQRESLLIP